MGFSRKVYKDYKPFTSRDAVFKQKPIRTPTYKRAICTELIATSCGLKVGALPSFTASNFC